MDGITKKELKALVNEANFYELMAIQPMMFVKDLDDCVTSKMAAEYLNVSSYYVNKLIKDNMNDFRNFGLKIFDGKMARRLTDEKKVEFYGGFHKYLDSAISLKMNTSRLINKDCFLYLVLISGCPIGTKLRQTLFNRYRKDVESGIITTEQLTIDDIDTTPSKSTEIIGIQNKEIQKLRTILSQSIKIDDLNNFIEMRA